MENTKDPTSKAKVSVLRLAPGYSQEHRSSNANRSGDRPQDEHDKIISFHNTSSSSTAYDRAARSSHRASANARAKLDGVTTRTALQASGTLETKAGKIQKALGQPTMTPPQGNHLVLGNDLMGDLEDCMPSRQQQQQEQSPPTHHNLLTKGRIPHEPSQYTTRGEEDILSDEPEAFGGRLSEPGAFAITSTTTTAAATAATASGTSTLDAVEHELEETQPNETTIVTAIKVSPEDDDVILDAEEAVRMARKEAEELRQQVKTLQQERRRNHNDVVDTTIPLATATVAQGDDVIKERTLDHGNNKTCFKMATRLWIIVCILVLVGCIIGGLIIGIFATQDNEDPAAVIVTVETMSPTPAPTRLPCLEEVSVDGLIIGNETTKLLLDVCQGDCDVDEDCGQGLICFQRSRNYEPVPGCSCWETDDSRNDYCISPPEDACLVESNDFPLGVCEGNCVDDWDCQDGFVCYDHQDAGWYDDADDNNGLQPSNLEFEVPGCKVCNEGYNNNTSSLLAKSTTSATISNSTTTTKYCVERQYCLDCFDKVDTDQPGFAGQTTAAGGFTIRMQYSTVLISVYITLFACW